jgi:twitching motility protein PilT
LTAIVRADGDALVLHAGERPYVVAPTGQSELASRGLTLDAMKGMLKELLPPEAQHALAEVGAVQHELPRNSFAGRERVTVIAARGGDDIWIEIRRLRAPVSPAPPVVAAPVVAPPAPAVAPIVEPPPVEERAVAEEPAIPEEPAMVAQQPPIVAEPEIDLPPAIHAVAPAEPSDDAWQVDLSTGEYEIEMVEPDEELPPAAPESQPVMATQPESADASVSEEVEVDEEVVEISLEPDAPAPEEPVRAVEPEPVVEQPAIVQPVRRIGPIEIVAVSSGVSIAPPEAKPQPEPEPEPQPQLTAEAEPEPEPEPDRHPMPEPRPAVVLPLARTHVRPEHPVRFSPLHMSGIDRLLRIAAARGASTLYLTSQARPSIRVDGEISPIEGEGVIMEPDVEALILDIIPERNREALRSHAGTEWICDVPEVGRIRCVTFRDHRGAGGIFRMIPARAIAADQLGLSREIQGLCAEAEGLVLVTGPRSSGKSTLVSAFVDLINRTRSDHVITLETQIRFVHENRLSLVSQREVRGDANELLLAAQVALRENPDVLVIEDIGSPDIVALALEAAQSGQLVIGALTAHTATEAVDRIIDQTPAERRPAMQLALAESLRGIVAQVLLRKPGGGRIAAREVLLNTSAVANVIAEGKTSQLPMAIDSGRKHGMVALNDALVAFVQGGVVDAREAFRRTADQQGFLAQLRRQGIDTSFVERLA